MHHFSSFHLFPFFLIRVTPSLISPSLSLSLFLSLSLTHTHKRTHTHTHTHTRTLSLFRPSYNLFSYTFSFQFKIIFYNLLFFKIRFISAIFPFNHFFNASKQSFKKTNHSIFILFIIFPCFFQSSLRLAAPWFQIPFHSAFVSNENSKREKKFAIVSTKVQEKEEEHSKDVRKRLLPPLGGALLSQRFFTTNSQFTSVHYP